LCDERLRPPCEPKPEPEPSFIDEDVDGNEQRLVAEEELVEAEILE
jgi:hypothetical protein